jgi:hypothetical protein
VRTIEEKELKKEGKLFDVLIQHQEQQIIMEETLWKHPSTSTWHAH